MVVTIELKPEVEMQVLVQAATQGVSVESFLASVIESNLPVEDPEPFYKTASPEEWSRAFSEWAASHSAIPTHVDDSRESIYEGRGE
jgi:hypothetical protein